MMKKLFLPLVMLLAIFTNAKADEYDFKTFKLGVSSYGGGAFSVSMEDRKLASGMLFFNHKSEDGKTYRYFQNGSFVKGKITPNVSKQGNDVLITFSGMMKRKENETSIPFSEKITVQSDGTLKFEYEVEPPADWKYREMPKVLITMPIKEVGGKKIVQKSAKNETTKIITEIYNKKTNAAGGELKELYIGTDFGPLKLIKQNTGISFHDTRSYQKDGPLRIDLSGENVRQKWVVSFSLKMPIESAEFQPKK